MSASGAAQHWREIKNRELAQQWGAVLMNRAEVARFVESRRALAAPTDPDELAQAAADAGVGIDDIDAGLLAVLLDEAHRATESGGTVAVGRFVEQRTGEVVTSHKPVDDSRCGDQQSFSGRPRS